MLVCLQKQNRRPSVRAGAAVKSVSVRGRPGYTVTLRVKKKPPQSPVRRGLIVTI
jgi:hypothetical protein